MASNRAATEILNLVRSGRRPTEDDARRIFFRAIVLAARRITPRLAAAAFPAMSPGAGQSEGEGTVLEMMIADTQPIA